MHEHYHAGTGKVLKWSLTATLLFVVVEFVAGLVAHSLALLSDAGHNFTDALALLLAWFGVYLQTKPPDEIKTYGYHRAGVLAAFVNSITLLLLSGYIFYESYERLIHPEPVREWIMLGAAALGFAVNGAIVWWLRRGRKSDINIRSAFLHMLGDALSSLGIVAGAIVLHFTGWLYVDPILSILIGVLIIWTARDIILESLNILLEGLPRGLKLNSVAAAMKGVEGVLDVHDLHIWSLGSSAHALSCHVRIEDVPPSVSEATLQRLNAMLEARFHISHTTVQFEHVNCVLSQNCCSIPVHDHE